MNPLVADIAHVLGMDPATVTPEQEHAVARIVNGQVAVECRGIRDSIVVGMRAIAAGLFRHRAYLGSDGQRLAHAAFERAARMVGALVIEPRDPSEPPSAVDDEEGTG